MKPNKFDLKNRLTPYFQTKFKIKVKYDQTRNGRTKTSTCEGTVIATDRDAARDSFLTLLVSDNPGVTGIHWVKIFDESGRLT